MNELKKEVTELLVSKKDEKDKLWSLLRAISRFSESLDVLLEHSFIRLSDDIQTKLRSEFSSALDLVEKHSSELLAEEIQDVQNKIAELGISFSTFKQKKPKNGKDGKAGRDGIDGKDGVNGKDGLHGTDGKDGRNGTDGKNGSPDTALEVRDKLASLKGDERLDISAIKNGDRMILGGMRGGSGAGAETVEETPIGAINGSNKTFTLPTLPRIGTVKLYLNGIRQKSGGDYTISSYTITMLIAPSGSDTLLADYEQA